MCPAEGLDGRPQLAVQRLLDAVIQAGCVHLSLQVARRLAVAEDGQHAADEVNLVVAGGQAVGRDGVAAGREREGERQRAAQDAEVLVVHEAAVADGVRGGQRFPLDDRQVVGGDG
jgi:hypothetical protein